MSKANRNIELPAVLGGQFCGDIMAIGRRPFANIHRHIQNCALCASHEFCLGVGRRLIMETAQNTLLAGQGVVILDERTVHTRLIKGVSPERLTKKAPVIAKTLRLHQNDVGDGLWEKHSSVL